MFTFAIFNNGREVDNLDAGTYPTEALARDAALVALDDLCPVGSPNRGTYRVEARAAARMSENMDKPGFAFTVDRYEPDDDETGNRLIVNSNATAHNVGEAASLLEAAPDLYAALEALAARFDSRVSDSQRYPELAAARAALSRAKGGV